MGWNPAGWIPTGKNYLKDLTGPQCEYFRQNCNFTPSELEVFELRRKDWSNVHVALALHMSERTVKRRIDAIRAKINQVL